MSTIIQLVTITRTEIVPFATHFTGIRLSSQATITGALGCDRHPFMLVSAKGKFIVTNIHLHCRPPQIAAGVVVEQEGAECKGNCPPVGSIMVKDLCSCENR